MARRTSMTLAGLLALFGTLASAETERCSPITAVPVTISTSGVYCLTANVTTAITSGTAITIAASDVRLDLNGWTLAGPAGSTTAIGIFSSAANVSIENGTVRGFYYGVELTGRAGRVEQLLLDHETMYGVLVAGQGALVRHNRVIATGGSTVAANRAAIGIAVRGPASLVDDNLVSGLTGTGTGGEFGIYVVYADNTTVRSNVVVDDLRPSASGMSTGVWVESSSGVSVVGTSLTNFQKGVAYNNAEGTYARNVAVSCDTPYYGGSAGSDND